MSKRLHKAERHYILREMLELARFLTVHSVPPPRIKDAVGQVRDDLVKMMRQGIIEITVDRNRYLESITDQEGSTMHNQEFQQALCNQCYEPLSEEEVSQYPLQWQSSGDMYCSEHRDCPDDCRHTPCQHAAQEEHRP